MGGGGGPEVHHLCPRTPVPEDFSVTLVPEQDGNGFFLCHQHLNCLCWSQQPLLLSHSFSNKEVDSQYVCSIAFAISKILL